MKRPSPWTEWKISISGARGVSLPRTGSLASLASLACSDRNARFRSTATSRELARQLVQHVDAPSQQRVLGREREAEVRVARRERLARHDQQLVLQRGSQELLAIARLAVGAARQRRERVERALRRPQAVDRVQRIGDEIALAPVLGDVRRQI